MSNFEEVTSPSELIGDTERYVRRIDPKCWISVLNRMTGFGWREWETAIVFIIEEGSRPKRWKSDDRDVLIIGGDWREELNDMPKEKLRDWHDANINKNRNTFDTIMEALK